jgi:hypothetical protein
MGSIPDHLVKHSFPVIMRDIMNAGIADPQILFLGVGDHTCDKAPLQVGQFESSDDLLNKWLTGLWLEGGGGANVGESYCLPWYFSKNTATDHYEKRGKKGVLITIGDEPVLKNVTMRELDTILGGQNQSMTAAEMLEMAEKKYEVFHIHMCNTRAGATAEFQNGWKQLMGERVKFAESKEAVEGLIVDIIKSVFTKQKSEPVQDTAGAAEAVDPAPVKEPETKIKY